MVLTGWKEIANYLHRGVRTAQRWAQTDGLPIHRPIQQNKRGPVIALSEDLDRWIQRGHVKYEQSEDLISRHQLIIDALRRNLDEQRELIENLRIRRLSRRSRKS